MNAKNTAVQKIAKTYQLVPAYTCNCGQDSKIICITEENSKCPHCKYVSDVTELGLFGLCSVNKGVFKCKANAFKFDWTNNKIINEEFECFKCNRCYTLNVKAAGCVPF